MEWVKKNIRNIIVFIGPILFEIANEISGNWTNLDGKIYIGLGKFITILIGVTYFGVLSYITYKEKNRLDELENVIKRNKELEKKNNIFSNVSKAVCNILGYTTEKTKNQIVDYRRNQTIDTSYVNATNAATIVCERIYASILELSEEHKDVTVNYYRKYIGDDDKAYTEMIAHEGYNTTPRYYMIPRLLKIDKKSYYCERLLDNSNPDTVFLKTKAEVAKAFGIPEENCKYNQYVGIPIRRFASKEKVALIEVVVHNNSIVWNDNEDVMKFVECYCENFKEYMLLIDMLTNLYDTVNKYKNVVERGQEYGKNIEISQER